MKKVTNFNFYWLILIGIAIGIVFKAVHILLTGGPSKMPNMSGGISQGVLVFLISYLAIISAVLSSLAKNKINKIIKWAIRVFIIIISVPILGVLYFFF